MGNNRVSVREDRCIENRSCDPASEHLESNLKVFAMVAYGIHLQLLFHWSVRVSDYLCASFLIATGSLGWEAGKISS